MMDGTSEPGSCRNALLAWLNRLYKAGFYLSAIFLTFVVGAVSTELNWPIANWARDAFAAGRALVSQHLLNEDEYPKLLWNVARTDHQGLVAYDADKSTGGYTLYSAGDSANVILVDERGDEVHRWSIPFSKMCPQSDVLNWVSDRSILIRRTQLFPNGDLMALYDTPAFTPSGCGLVRVTRDGEVIWAFDDHAHHDFAVGETGETWVLTNDIRRTPHDLWNQIELPFIEEFVVQLDTDGTPIKRLSLFDLLGQSEYHQPLLSFSDQLGDVLHSNTVNIVSAEFAAHYDAVSAGDLMVCLRNLNRVIVINPDSERIVWSATGPWNRPHDPDPLENGRLLIFDNCYANGSSHGSRVLEVDPRLSAIAWSYSGTDDNRLVSQIRSSQQLLANGNVLITESDFGRILEVTRNGETVWEYVHPVRGESDGRKLVPVVCGAGRYAPQQLTFLTQNTNDGEHVRVAHGN